MTTAAPDPALDMSLEGLAVEALSDAYRPRPPASQWLAQRGLAWGGSEVGALLTAYGLAPLGALLPAWIVDQAQPYARLGVPKLIAWKAGLRARPQGDKKTMTIGQQRERELLHRYRDGVGRHRIRPQSVRHVSSLPDQFLPIRDKGSDHLAVTPDAWAKALDGELVAIELKTTRKPLTIVRAPWHHRCQLTSEQACMGAHYGILVVGECWADPDVPDGPVRAFAERLDEPLVDLIRTVTTEAWGVVERLRDYALEADALEDRRDARARQMRRALADACGAAWAESVERMRAFRDPERERLEESLGAVEDLDELTDYAA